MVSTAFTFCFKKKFKESGWHQNLSVHGLRHADTSLLSAWYTPYTVDRTKRQAQEKVGRVMGL